VLWEWKKAYTKWNWWSLLYFKLLENIQKTTASLWHALKQWNQHLLKVNVYFILLWISLWEFNVSWTKIL
jgi:hypothetical protein